MTDHSHKVFIVTGANSGVGLETAKGLARRGVRVIMTARDPQKGERAMAEVAKEAGGDKLHLQMLDLASLKDVDAAADQLLADHPRIDGLINNAGLGSAVKGRTEDGFDLVMGTNHLGPFRLTQRLLDRLLYTAGEHGEARVVNVSSLAHNFARRFDPEDLMPEPRPRLRDAYAESKMANLLHARELARRYGERGLRAHAVHPGFVDSGFFRPEHFPGTWQLIDKVSKPMQISPAEGAKPSLHAALSDEAGRTNGRYFVKEQAKEPYLPENAERVQERLWARTEALIAEALGEQAAA
jgi:dehydrogenase/reductase SDR family protein 13